MGMPTTYEYISRLGAFIWRGLEPFAEVNVYDGGVLVETGHARDCGCFVHVPAHSVEFDLRIESTGRKPICPSATTAPHDPDD